MEGMGTKDTKLAFLGTLSTIGRCLIISLISPKRPHFFFNVHISSHIALWIGRVSQMKHGRKVSHPRQKKSGRRASNVGYTYWSHDICGAAGNPELDTRWVQFGTLSPIFRELPPPPSFGGKTDSNWYFETGTHGSGNGGCADTEEGCVLVDLYKHPWKNFDIERKALQDRAALLPYIYNASYEAFATGLGIIRPMYYEYPALDDAYKQVNQYFLGYFMMVSPVTVSSGGDFNLAPWSVWIPPGNWYESHSGAYLTGPQTLEREFDLSEIPVYVSAGSILVKQPFERGRVLGVAGESFYSHLRFDLYPSKGVLKGSTAIYEDDGFTFDYLQGDTQGDKAHAITRFYYEITGNSAPFTFTATISTDGSYPQFPSERYYSVQIRNVFPPTSVKCNGNVQAYNEIWYGFDRESERDAGWFFDGNEMSVIVNCPQFETSQNAVISMTFSDSLDNYLEKTDGIKGKIYRSVLSKNTLDEANVNYGTDRANLTTSAGYGLIKSWKPWKRFKSFREFNRQFWKCF